ncbi:helix-turn-helix domain-containing protein [Belliella pelovolcani]|uniref:DNA-binding transcriptional regulator, XRE-family HTH domain n=1 Tax=Belliella pelovolcani TaxID=529505 RepID=A0A1N7Q2Y7_9BACT|nr:helix-turn-helix transcriptional regulator [Belliella pelovolcani]SIT17254.1 DNA-binding transcriptional regulator, XRE-family HTH domain [Belliella pelovolcani]
MIGIKNSFYLVSELQIPNSGDLSKGYTQQQMADLIHTHRTGYSKMENNQQEIPVDALVLVAKSFGMSVDEVIYFDEKNGVPAEVSVNDKAALEQLQLINELDEEEKSILLKLIETFVSKKRFKDYLQKNIAAL